MRSRTCCAIRDRRRQFGENGRAAVESTFTEEIMAANMLKVFEDVASRKSTKTVRESVATPV